MKKLSISLIALAALALGACTSDDIALNENTVVGEGGDGYISLAINLPTTPSTRANDNYDDGLASEYAVNDATLLLFEGTNEDNAVCYATYTLATTFTTQEPSTDNITSRQQITQKIDSPVSGNLYALVILNDNGMESKVGGYIGKSLEALQTTAVNLGGVSGMTTTGLFMANAPLISAPGGTAAPTNGTVTTLAPIDANKIYASQAQAEANPATEIYVERGMAKVTMSAENLDDIVLDGQTLTVTVNGFALDQTNNVTYPVRNTHTADAWWGYATGNTNVTSPYRFAGNTPVATGLYRTYFATDPNYDAAPAQGEMTSIIDNFPTTLTAADGETPAYCLENTFNVAHQNNDETTRAIVKVTLGGADFYIWDGNRSLLYDKTSILNLAETVFSENPDVEAALALYNQTSDFFTTYVTVSLKETTATDDATVEITISDELTGECFRDGEIPEVFTTGLADVVEALNAAHTIGFYEGGVNYYSVLIKHFGDDLTPWNLETVMTDANSNDNSYPEGIWSATAEQNWLGRYGVLRNNWYDLNITAITGLGSATPPEATGEQDDPTEQWISVRINILSWARRTQNVEL